MNLSETLTVYLIVTKAPTNFLYPHRKACKNAVILECNFTVMTSHFDISAKNRPPEYLNTIPPEYFYVVVLECRRSGKCREIPKFQNFGISKYLSIVKIMFEFEYRKSRNNAIT
uniref:Uncharacterized protein n=1 Tax=Glossina austeni TaxID=7395 RepID=A0A1A9VFT4_GLOAU